jgi:hypothetical protein
MSRFIKSAGINGMVIISIFLLKIAAGIFNGWVMLHYTTTTDTWFYHSEALKEYHLLFTDPKTYLVDIFQSGYQNGYHGFFNLVNSYWSDLKNNLIIKLLSIFDIFSGGSYYINVIFFNFIVLFGNIALYKIFTSIYPNKKIILLISCFLLPSFLLFTSAIHKEGLIFFALAIILYITYTSINKKRIRITGILSILLCSLFILLERSFILIVLLPALVAWLIIATKKYPPVKTFTLVYIISILIFFTVGLVSAKVNMPDYVVAKQLEFLQLKGANSFIHVDTLQPTSKSFAHNFPQSIDHGLLRPYLFEKRSLKYLYPFAIEILLYELLFLFFIFLPKQNIITSINNRAFILFGLFFGLSIIVIIGYTIPITGAIIRYRSIYLPFILTPLLCSINWKRLKF